MTVTTLFLWTSIWCFLLVGSSRVTLIEGECDEDDYDANCVLDDCFTKCWLVCRLRTDDVTLVGEYSVCQESRKSAVRSFKCIQGEWIPTDQHSPPTPMPRKKRWLWRGGSNPSVRAPTVTNYPPEITCPSDITVKASSGMTSARASWTVPTASDPNGGTPSVTRTEGDPPGSTFDEGSTMIEYTARDSTGLTDTCYFLVTVSVTYCSDSDRQSFGPPGTQNCSGGPVNNVYGSVCVHQCPTGYILRGNASVSCQSNGQWDHDFPSCQDLEIPHFVNGCPPDQHLFASRLGEETLVFWTPPDVTSNSDDALNVTSDFIPGTSFPPGVTTVTYTATDLKGNNTCQFSVNVSVLQCKAPEEAISNQTELTFSCPDEHVHGARCTLGCTQGYSLLGEKAVVCERDNNTHPPTMHWEGAVGALGHPKCIVDNCLPLSPPQNGALSCLLGEVALDCMLHCDAAWDLPANMNYFNGHLFCNSETGIWRPSRAPDCVVWHSPRHVRVRSSLFYLTDSCETSLDAVRDNFITRLTQSIFKTGCVGVPTCSAHNVEVTCSPVTQRGTRAVDVQSRSEEDWMERVRASQRRRRSSASHYVLVTFHVQIHVLDSPQSAESAYQEFQSTHDRLMQSLKFHAASGQLSLDNLHADDFSLGPSLVVANCPPGTLLRPDHRSSQRFACVGCSKGYFLAVNGTVCQQCPVGSYSEVDNATACTPCPAGWSTSDTASQHRFQCQVSIP